MTRWAGAAFGVFGNRSILRFAVAGFALISVPATAGPLAAATTTKEIFGHDTADPYTLAVRATVWGYPLVRAAQLRQKATQPDAPFAPRGTTVATAPLNRLGRARQLSDPATRIGVAPNNDTLYVLAFLDTEDGPFLLRTPDFGTRYYVFQFGEADSSTHHSYGQSTHRGKLPPIFVTGPGYRGPTPARTIVVRSEQRYMMIAGRILVTGADELPVVHRLEDRISLERWLGPNRVGPTTVTTQRALAGTSGDVPERLKLLADLGSVLQDWKPTTQDQRLIRSFAEIGITPRDGLRLDQLDLPRRSAVEEGIVDGLAIIQAKTRHLGVMANGWSTSYAGSTFGTDDLLRAAVAMDQIYVVDKDEALYPVAHVDTSGKPLDGRNDYVVCFSKRDLPPVNAFWSITMYYAKGFLVPNPIKRYSIGDRTPGIRYEKDGSLRLYVQNESPGPAREANWLPAPNQGFMLMMRLYRPQLSALDGKWNAPGIVPVGEKVAEAVAGRCANS